MTSVQLTNGFVVKMHAVLIRRLPMRVLHCQP